MSALFENFYGDVLVVRTPSPITFNKAGANYKSEVPHLEYSPRAAYQEWLAICDAILELGGDALFVFEDADEIFLDRADLTVDAQGAIKSGAEVLGHVDQAQTGRVFAANGPWVLISGQTLLALMPNMLPHRRAELSYYETVLKQLAQETSHTLSLQTNPARWEGLADVVVLEEKVIFTHTVASHYDAQAPGKTLRSSLEGAKHAASFAGLRPEDCVYAELAYPHFHGDTVHFGLRKPGALRAEILMHYSGGLWAGSKTTLRQALDQITILPITEDDAVEAYAANSRQVREGVITTKGASQSFLGTIHGLGLKTKEVDLFELFGKAGGGPGCATLFLPRNLNLPAESPLRYSRQKEHAYARLERLAERLTVDPGYFNSQTRG